MTTTGGFSIASENFQPGPEGVRVVAHDADVTVQFTTAPGEDAEIVVRAEAELGGLTVREDGRVTAIEVPPLVPRHGKGLAFSWRGTAVRLGDGTTADVTLTLPPGTAVQVEVKTGDVHVGPGAGALRITALSGDVSLADADGVEVSTGTGDVAAQRVADGSIATGSGDVELGHASGTVRLRTSSGDVMVRAMDAGELHVRTGSGDVTVGVADGVPVWQDCASGTGEITSSLPALGEPEPGQPWLRLRVVTGTGDITLAPAD